MPTAVKVKKRYVYIPDTSFAEEWLTPDIFKVKRGRYFRYYRILPDGKVARHYVRNGRKKGGSHGTTDKR